MRRFVCLVLCIALMMFASGVSASAAQVLKLKTDEWFTADNWDKEHVYKLTVTADAILTCEWKDSISMLICNLYEEPECVTKRGYIGGHTSKNGSESIAVSKGVYYVQVFTSTSYADKQVKFTLARAVNKKNYCRSKALALSSGKTVKIAQTVDHCYNRWYKITLNQRKKVTVKTNKSSSVSLYDPKLKTIECTRNDKSLVTNDKLKKGVYFIRVSYWPSGVYLRGGEYITIKWN